MTDTAGDITEHPAPPAPRPVGVWLLCLALSAVLAAAAWLEPRGVGRLSGTSSVVAAVLVGVMFAAGELWPAEIELRRQSHSFVFTSVPMVAGLLLLPIPVVRALRVGSSLVVLGVIRPHPAIKLTVNLAAHALEVTVAGLVMTAVGVPDGLGPRSWLAAALAVVAADTASSLVITLAISLYQRSWEPSILAAAGVPMLFAMIDVALALIVAGDIRRSSYDVLLAVPVGAYVVLLTHRYARLASRYRGIERLDRFARELGAAVIEGDVTVRLLRQVADVMHAEQAWIWTVDAPGPNKVVLRSADGESHTVEPSPFDRATLEEVRGGRRLFPVSDVDGLDGPDGPDGPGPEGSDLTEALIGCLAEGSAGPVIIGVGDRSGTVRSFDNEDVVLFETLCSHAGLALRNVALVDELRAESASNEFLATHDPLTGLPNRVLLQRHAAAALAAGRPFTLLLLDLERFKEVNDTLGHIRGDEVLIEVSRRLEPLVGPDDLLCRLGGDEFVLYLTGCDPVTTFGRAWAALAEIRRPFSVAGVEIDLDASVGISLSDDLGPDEAADPASLLRRADVAMYTAKTNHSGVVVYTPDSDSYDARRLAMASRLRRAIEQGDLVLYYQPQIDLVSGAVVGVEALARWHDPERGDVPPTEFIEVAERTDVIHALTRYVLRAAIAQAAAWRAEGHDLRVAVNVSVRNLGEENLVDAIAGLLAASGLPATNLEIELTETAVMTNPAQATEVMTGLRNLGIRIAIDDFGTGHSSLGYLTTLAVDQLKIDRSFVHAMATDPTAGTVVKAIVDLARSLGLEVVAEGVETTTSVAALQAMRCTTAQGYYYSRPMPAPQLAPWLVRHHQALLTTAAAAPPAG